MPGSRFGLSLLLVVPMLATVPSPVMSAPQRVELEQFRTETAQVFAEPGGGRTLEQYAYPVRARRGSSWVPIDTTLRFQPDGSVRPEATVTSLVFSGGVGDLAVLGSLDRQVRLGWPKRLPRPVLSGDTATYPEVLPGVDLQLRAQAAGFAQLLVVKNRAAASNPALRRLRFPVAGRGLGLATRADGTTVAQDPTGHVLFTAGTAVMWDSPQPARSVVNRLRTLRTVLAGNDLVVEPDLAMLTAPDARFPISIDPSFGSTQYRWTKVNRRLADQSYWTTYREHAMTGYAPGGAGAGDMFRSFFQFDTAALAGSMVKSAQFQIVLDRTLPKHPKPVDLWHTRSIDPAHSLTWNNSGGHWIEWLAQASGHAGQDQPDMAMGFSSAALLRVVQKVANDEASSVTLGLRAPDEWNGDQWKEFWPATAKVVVNYNNAPFAPDQVNFRQPRQCGSAAAPAMVETSQPSFTAVASDPDGDNLTSTLSIHRADTDALEYQIESSVTTPGAPFTWPAVPPGELAAGLTYYFQARSGDGVDLGPLSDRCYFAIDEEPPGEPVIESSDYPDGQAVIPAHTAGVVVLRPAAGEGDVAGFGYGFRPDALTQRIPIGPDGSARLPVTLSPDPVTGVIGARLFVGAIDRAGNLGPTTPGWSLRALPAARPVPSVRDDLNGDARADVGAVLDHGNGRTAIWNLLGADDGGFHSGHVGWDSGDDGGFALQRTRALRGDFDGDGRTDVAMLRTEPGHRLALFRFQSDGNGYAVDQSPVWRGDSTGWQLDTARLVAGDINGDGRADVGVQVNNGNGTWRMLVFAGPDLSTPVEWLPSATGEWARGTPLLGDSDGDGDDDLLVLRDAGSCRTVVELYRSDRTAFTPAQTLSDVSGNCHDRTKATVGDVDGDQRDDIVMRYEHGAADIELRVLRAAGTTVESWWRSPGVVDSAYTTMSTGDFSADGKHDVALLSGSSGRELFTLTSTGTSFGAPQSRWREPAVGAVGAAKFDVEHRSYELVARHSRRCLAIRGGSQTEGAVIEQQGCTGALHQRYQIDPIVGSAYAMLHPAHADAGRDDGRSRCLDVGRPAQPEGAALIQQPCLGVQHQRFVLEYVAGTSHDSVVRLNHGGRCATVRDGGLSDGSPVVQQTCGALAQQEWILRPALNTPQLDGRYKLSAVRGLKVIEVTNCAQVDGADLRMADWNSSSGCQRWQLRPLGDDTYQIVDPASQKAIEPQNCATRILAIVHLWSATDLDCQRWRIEPAHDSSWSILHVMSGKALDVAGCRHEAGADLILWNYWNGPCQRWKLEHFPTNLALHRPVQASSVEKPETAAGNAVDGNPGTRWSSGFADPQWISVDLGATRRINQVVLQWEAAHGRQYRIETSPDGTTWTTVHTRSDGDGGTDNISLSGVNARHVRMYGTQRATEWGYSLFEFEVR